MLVEFNSSHDQHSGSCSNRCCDAIIAPIQCPSGRRRILHASRESSFSFVIESADVLCLSTPRIAVELQSVLLWSGMVAMVSVVCFSVGQDGMIHFLIEISGLTLWYSTALMAGK